MKKFLKIVYPSVGLFLLFLTIIFSRKNPEESQVVIDINEARTIEAVAALGQLSPSGEIRMLAAPISGFGGTPRIKKLLINEGDEVAIGQILAVFDNQARILADLEIAKARLYTLNNNVIAQKREISRYKESVSQGASPKILLEKKNDDLNDLLGKKKQLLAEINGLKVDLSDSQLKSPIDGMVLKINFRAGERPGAEGVLQVGSNKVMEAIIEVYESDINRVAIAQKVSLISENGGFSGTLSGKVRKISPQISQRKVLSTDPTGDADARVVEVRVTLDPSSSSKVESYTGMKVIARFEP